jgi:N-acyl-D-amino-acid deacylase
MKMRLIWRALGRVTIGLTAMVIVTLAQQPAPTASTTLIRGALLIDGSGEPARRGDVRVAGDRIVAVGQLSPEPAERSFDAAGQALAPGFIDTHSHHDRGLDTARDGLAMVSQGVTTIVVGQDGGGSDLASLFARLDQQTVAVNVASYAGHGAIRSRVLGKDFARHATAPEVERMKALRRG